MSGLHYVPVDAQARNGRGHLLRSADGHLHAGRWNKGAWRYGCGTTISKEITHYVRPL